MEKPWFKFTAVDWLSGSIQLLTDAEKGTYIDLVSLIWKENGQIINNEILCRKLRLSYATACERINSYCELGILVCDNDILSIKFLSEQLLELDEKSKQNSENAKKRWQKQKTPMRTHANKKRKEEKREEEKEKKVNQKKFTPPSLEEVKNYFLENGYTEESAKKAFDYYNVADWVDSKGNKIKSWKQKMQGVWFKDENKIVKKPRDISGIPQPGKIYL